MKLQRQTILTLEDGLNALAQYAGGEIPSTSDEEYPWWVSWLQRGQEDAAKRAFWRRLLGVKELVTDGVSSSFPLPSDFYRHNGIYKLILDGVDISKPNNDLEMVISVNIDNRPVINETANPQYLEYKLDIDRVLPANTKLTLQYAFNAPIPTELSDKFILDGEMIVMYAMGEYYRQTGEQGSEGKANQDYENRFNELISLEAMPQFHEISEFDINSTQVKLNRNQRNRLISGLDRS